MIYNVFLLLFSLTLIEVDQPIVRIGSPLLESLGNHKYVGVNSKFHKVRKELFSNLAR